MSSTRGALKPWPGTEVKGVDHVVAAGNLAIFRCQNSSIKVIVLIAVPILRKEELILRTMMITGKCYHYDLHNPEENLQPGVSHKKLKAALSREYH